MKKIGMIIMSLFVLSGCTSGGEVTESIEAVKAASDNMRLLENGAYTNWVKQSMQDMSVENKIDGLFIKKKENYDWYTKLVLVMEEEFSNHTVSEIVQIDGVQKSRFNSVGADELQGWMTTAEVSEEEPPNLFFQTEMLPSKKYIEKLEITEDEAGMHYSFVMNQAYEEFITKDAVTKAEEALEEAKQKDDFPDSIPILEENVARVAAINYDNIIMAFTIDHEGILISHETTMDMVTSAEADQMETAASVGTRITEYNKSEIEDQIPRP